MKIFINLPLYVDAKFKMPQYLQVNFTNQKLFENWKIIAIIIYM